ncbi:AMP-binding protein [Kribbia dieselivorans]|uniref:AMP-binding protein n=1 Tax=Kribbia dieselivorans TaxID=331526 RepID=UPI0008399B37|nr:AMP-binding protein [Kribbia dieselivorans]
MTTDLKTVHDRYSEQEIAAWYESGYWTTESFAALAHRQAEAHGDKTSFIDDRGSLTYAQFEERALRLAVGLHRQGIQRGQRVVVQLPNWTEFPTIALALSRIGAVLVPVMPIYRNDEVAYVLQHSGAVAAITCGSFRNFDHAAMFRSLRQQAPAVKNLWVARSEGEEALDALIVEGDLATLTSELPEDSRPDDAFLIVYTSGTTSRPKGCLHTFNTVRTSAAAIHTALDYTADDVQFGPSPITHATGLVTSVVLPMLAGASSYLMEVWEPTAGVAAVKRHGCTAAVTAAPFLQMLLDANDPGQNDAGTLTRWICAGSPIPPPLVERAGRELPGLRVLSLYGRSENFVTTTCSTGDDPGRALTSDGQAVDGGSVKIVGGDGLEVARGEEGDIAYRGPSHMIEYFHDDEQTGALFTPEGYSRSGDLGRMDEDGFVRVTGRTKDLIIRGGMNISAREIEEHLMRHDSVSQVAAVGMPDDRLGEKVCIYVVPADGASPTLAELTDFLRSDGIATQKLPERLEVVDALPMTATGKVQKHVLRQQIAERLAAV